MEKGLRIAAWLLEAANADIEFSVGRFRVKGTDRSVDLFAVAAAALRADAPSHCRGPLDGTSDETLTAPSFPYGSAVCEVEVDPETGVVDVVRYTTVDDCGRAVNPMILHGQTHGGIARAWGRRCGNRARTTPRPAAPVVDADGLRAAPRRHAAGVHDGDQRGALDVPSARVAWRREGGTTPALGAVVNALVDALAELGVEHIELPETSSASGGPSKTRGGRARAMIRAHLLRWRPRPTCQRNARDERATNFRLRGPRHGPAIPLRE